MFNKIKKYKKHILVSFLVVCFSCNFGSLFLALVYDQRQRSLARSFKQEKLQFINDAQIVIADIPIIIDVTADIRAGKFCAIFKQQKKYSQTGDREIKFFLLLLLV